jgi:hypothetical protein
MKYLFILLFGLGNFSLAQYHDNQLKKFVKEVNKNLLLIQKQATDLVHSEHYFGLTEKEVVNPFYDYEFEILEPFQISQEGEISMKLKFLKEEEPFIYWVKAPLDKLAYYGVDIYFILTFENEDVRVVIDQINSSEATIHFTNFFHLGMDQTKMRKTAEKAGIKEGYFYP